MQAGSISIATTERGPDPTKYGATEESGSVRGEGAYMGPPLADLPVLNDATGKLACATQGCSRHAFGHVPGRWFAPNDDWR